MIYDFLNAAFPGILLGLFAAVSCVLLSGKVQDKHQLTVKVLCFGALLTVNLYRHDDKLLLLSAVLVAVLVITSVVQKCRKNRQNTIGGSHDTSGQ